LRIRRNDGLLRDRRVTADERLRRTPPARREHGEDEQSRDRVRHLPNGHPSRVGDAQRYRHCEISS
jgi:hypothetical protein